MFKPRFSMASALVMIVVMILIAVWMMREEGTGFETTRGVPFVWYHWADYKHASPFNLFALAGDIVFWLPIVLSSGFLVEKLIRRFETRGKHRS